MAWFAAVVGFSLAVMAVNCYQRPDWFLRDLRDGLLAGCMIYGIIVASIVEVPIVVVRRIRDSMQE